MAAKKKARSAASKKKAAGIKKASGKKKTATRKVARTAAAKRKPIPRSADAPSHIDPVRAFARSFALRHQR